MSKRYGWNGIQDELLQSTFDYAQKSYPWLQNYRDRSVTELEFLHGHLNEIGAIPACFYFRDKVMNSLIIHLYDSNIQEKPLLSDLR